MSQDAKTLSALGSLFIVISPILFLIPILSGILSLAGAVLFLIGLSKISNSVNEPKMFSQGLWAILLPLIVSFIAVMIIGVTIVAAAISFGLAVGSTQITENIDLQTIISLMSGVGIVGLIIIILCFISIWVSVIIYGLKMNTVSELLNKHFPEMEFKVAGTLFKIGGWLSILLVGGLLIWIAWILYTVKFFQAKAS
ncbi:MAG: DUF996 domain-containing protein [Brevinematia bacterium]